MKEKVVAFRTPQGNARFGVFVGKRRFVGVSREGVLDEARLYKKEKRKR